MLAVSVGAVVIAGLIICIEKQLSYRCLYILCPWLQCHRRLSLVVVVAAALRA